MWKSFTYEPRLRTLWTHPAFGHIYVPPTSRHLETGGQDDNLTHNFVLKQRDNYYNYCRGVLTLAFVDGSTVSYVPM